MGRGNWHGTTDLPCTKENSSKADRSKYVLKHYMGKPGLWGHIVNYISYRIEKYWPVQLPSPQIKIDGKNVKYIAAGLKLP